MHGMPRPRHLLVCGDSRDPQSWQRLLGAGGARPTVVFTSPPYASQRKYDEGSGFKPIPPDEYGDWWEAVQAGVRDVLAGDGSFFVNIKEHCEDGQRHLYVKRLVIRMVEAWGWRFVDELCWRDTKNGMPGTFPSRFKDAWEPIFHFSANKAIKFDAKRNASKTTNAFVYSSETHIELNDDGFQKGERRTFCDGMALPSNVLEIPSGGTGEHSAAFPVALPTFFVRAYSDPGDTIADPFMGSGSTAIAAAQEGRLSLGVEISPKYMDVIRRRLTRWLRAHNLAAGGGALDERTAQPAPQDAAAQP
jgi:DNA modification methylase